MGPMSTGMWSTTPRPFQVSKGCCPSCGGPMFSRACLGCTSPTGEKQTRPTSTSCYLQWKAMKNGRSTEWRAYRVGDLTEQVYGSPTWRLPKSE
jgi:hypothetical protein